MKVIRYWTSTWREYPSWLSSLWFFIKSSLNWEVLLIHLNYLPEVFATFLNHLNYLFQILEIWRFFIFIIIFIAKKMKFSIKDFCSKCDQIPSFLRIWSHFLKKSLVENFIFCVVFPVFVISFCAAKNRVTYSPSRTFFCN